MADDPSQAHEGPSQADHSAPGLQYWKNASADVGGMLGGFPQISKVDLRGSRSFLAQLGIGKNQGRQTTQSVLEGGAGIGRITTGLLVDIAENVDVIEPVKKFTDQLHGVEGVRNIYTMGLQDWMPAKDLKYDLIWIQWCVGHLTDPQLVLYLQRCQTALRSRDSLIVVKENLSTSGGEAWDDTDSCLTREDTTFKRLFKEAGLRLVKTSAQKGLSASPVRLLPVQMYALKAAS